MTISYTVSLLLSLSLLYSNAYGISTINKESKESRVYNVHKAYIKEDKENKENIILELKEEFNNIKPNKKYIIKLPNTRNNEVFVNDVYHSQLEVNPKPNENGTFKEIVVENKVYKLDADTGDIMFVEYSSSISPIMGGILVVIIFLAILIVLRY